MDRFGEGTLASPSPHAPQAATTLLTSLSVTAGSGKRHFYLRPAAVAHPLEASLPLQRLAPTVTRRPRHPQPQPATGFVEGHPSRGRIQLDWKDEVVSRLSAPVLAPSLAPPALTGLVEVQCEIGGPVDVVPPARLHPGRGVGEDVDVVVVQGVRRPRARLKPLAQPGRRVAGAGSGRKVGSGWGNARHPDGFGMRRAHVPTCPAQDASRGFPRTWCSSPPRCPTHQSVRR